MPHTIATDTVKKESDNNKVPNNVEQSPTSASSSSAVNTSSSSSSSSSSKQSSTSSLTDAISLDVSGNAGDKNSSGIINDPANNSNTSADPVDKLAPVIVKLAKADDGNYYNKKKDEINSGSSNKRDANNEEMVAKNNGDTDNNIKAEPMDVDSSSSKNNSASFSGKSLYSISN